MITVAVENVRERHHATASCHSRKQILILAAVGSLIVTTDLVKHFTTKHRRAMGKGNITGTTHKSPAIARPDFSTTGVNSVAERSNNGNIRTAVDNVPLPSKSLGMSDVVSIHTCHYRSTRLQDHGVGTTG